jgi:hypothetical protein
MAQEQFGFELPNYVLPVFSNADDGGISSGGSTSSLVDVTKYWNPGVWVGALLVISIDKQIYFTTVTGNTGQTLFFTAFPSTVKIYQNNYILKRNPAIPVVSPTSVVYTSQTAPIAGTYYSTMVDCSAQDNIVFHIVNTTNVIVTVQVIGNITNAPATASTINGVISVPAGGIAEVGVNLTTGYWRPFIGIQIVVPGGAISGTVVVSEVTRS